MIIEAFFVVKMLVAVATLPGKVTIRSAWKSWADAGTLHASLLATIGVILRPMIKLFTCQTIILAKEFGSFPDTIKVLVVIIQNDRNSIFVWSIFICWFEATVAIKYK